MTLAVQVTSMWCFGLSLLERNPNHFDIMLPCSTTFSNCTIRQRGWKSLPFCFYGIWDFHLKVSFPFPFYNYLNLDFQDSENKKKLKKSSASWRSDAVLMCSKYTVIGTEYMFPSWKSLCCQKLKKAPTEHRSEVYPFELFAIHNVIIKCHISAHLSNPKCLSMREKHLVN